MIIDKKEILKFAIKENKFSLYFSPFVNLLNSITNSTRPKKVGQLSTLFQDFLYNFENKNGSKIPSLNEWIEYYNSIPNVLKDTNSKTELTGNQAIEEATKNIYSLFLKFQEYLFDKITIDNIRKWVEDLIYQKTYNGMMLEGPVASFCAKKILEIKNKKSFKKEFLRKSNPSEESKGIDYIYYDGEIKLLIQVKTGNRNNFNNVKKRKSNIIKINDDIYCCNLEEKENNKFEVTISVNNEILIK